MADLSGQTLGKYQIVERLGRGGMADVFKAYQPGLERYVAVKVLHPHLSQDADFITRFKREAQSVANLRHPNIVQVFDFDTSGQNYYMVMEFVEGGQTLKEVLQEASARGRRLPVAQTVDIIAQLADALEYAHKQGMVHRDIKPSNVLVASLDHPVLSDFGIARIVGQTALTGTGAMMGTPAYMSPEQGRGEQADERADIYAMGIMLYEMLTGKPPYDADTPYGIILKHMNDPIPSPRAVVADFPAALEPVILKTLAKDRNDRYASAGKLRDALRAAASQMGDVTSTGDTTEVLAPGSAETAPIPMPTAAPAPAKKPFPVWVPIVGVAAVVVLGAAAFLSGIFNPPASTPSAASAAPPEKSVVVRLSPTCPAPTVTVNDTVFVRGGYASGTEAEIEDGIRHLSFVVSVDGASVGPVTPVVSPIVPRASDPYACTAVADLAGFIVYFDFELGHLAAGTHTVSLEFTLDAVVSDSGTPIGPGVIGTLSKTFDVSP